MTPNRFAGAQRPHAYRLLQRWPASGALVFAALLAGCGGGGSGSAEPPPAARNEAAIATATSAELMSYVRGKLSARGPQGAAAADEFGLPTWLGVTLISTTGTVTAGATDAAGRAGTGTVVQEAGVDEDDLLKTDGNLLFDVQALPHDGTRDTRFARLRVHGRQADGKPTLIQSTELELPSPAWTGLRGLQIDPQGHYAAVIAESAFGGWLPIDCPPENACITALLPYRPMVPRVHLQLLDLGRAAGLLRPERPVQRLEIDGHLIGSRRIGSTLVVALSHTPRFAFDQLLPSASAAAKQAALDALTPRDVLPSIRIDGGAPQLLVSENDCWLQAGNTSLSVSVSTITTIDLASPGYPRRSRCFLGGTEALYMSSTNLYLATSRSQVQVLDNRPVFAPEFRTDIHKFAVDGTRIDYRGSGSVTGHLGWDRERTPYRMSEHRGDLRVLSFTGAVGWMSEADMQRIAASPATLTVLRERSSDASLQIVSILPNSRRPGAIGKPGEQVYAVRFVGDRGYVVTFRRTDPLYVLDLADPADPRVAGELEVPGFSDWLYPIDGGLLFGVGKDADERGRVKGIKVGLFDVRDAANPKVIDSKVYGSFGSATALDFSAHGISLDVANGRTRIALPMQLMGGNASAPAQTLQRFEVDPAARSLLAKPAIDFGSAWVDLSAVRTVQLGEQLYHLRDGQLTHWAW